MNESDESESLIENSKPFDAGRKLLWEYLKNSAVLITLVSTYGYLAWFLFEMGNCHEYGIPTYFITPSMTEVLLFVTSVLFVIIITFKSLGITYPLLHRMNDPKYHDIHPLLFMNVIMLTAGLLIIGAYSFSTIPLLCVLGLILTVNLFTWGVPFLFKLRQKGSSKEKLQKALAEAQSEHLDYLTALKIQLTRRQFYFLIICISIPCVSYFLGSGVGRTQTTYQTFADESNVAILKKFDNLIFCRAFDPVSGKMSDTLQVRKIDDQQRINLLEHRGKLYK